MATSIVWDEQESGSFYNTAVNATASEVVVQGTQRVDAFNSLLVMNNDVVRVQIQLDGQTALGRVFEITGPGGVLQIDPASGDDIWFKQVVQKNLDAAVNETANKILFRWSKKVPQVM